MFDETNQSSTVFASCIMKDGRGWRNIERRRRGIVRIVIVERNNHEYIMNLALGLGLPAENTGWDWEWAWVTRLASFTTITKTTPGQPVSHTKQRSKGNASSCPAHR
jgi:hypothetical protein